MASCLTIEREAVDLSDHCPTLENVPRNCVSIFWELNPCTETERASKPLQLGEVHSFTLHVGLREKLVFAWYV